MDGFCFQSISREDKTRVASDAANFPTQLSLKISVHYLLNSSSNLLTAPSSFVPSAS